MSIRTLTAGLAAVGLIAAIPAGASAAKLSRAQDPDRDGLSTKVERKIGTKPRKADTDRDRLKDGAEVRLGSNPLKADTDGDGAGDGAEVRRGDHPCGPATPGTVASVDTGAATVTFTLADGSSKTVNVNSSTVLRGITDRDGSGAVTIADLQAGDKVVVRTSADDDNLATMIAIPGAGRGDHGDEVEGSVSAVGTDSVTLTLADGSSKTLTVNSSTKFKGPDRDASGTVTLADIVAGDKVEAHVSSTDPNLATEIKVEGTKVWGTVSAVGLDSVTVTTATGASLTATVTSTTKFRIPDTDGSGTPGLADLQVGQQIDMITVDSGSGGTVALAIGSGRGGHGGRGPRSREDGSGDAPQTQGGGRDRGQRGGRGPRGFQPPQQDLQDEED